MALDLPYFAPGGKLRDQLTAERLNKIVAAIRSLEIQPGANIHVSRTPGGTSLKAVVPQQKGGAAAAEEVYPFRLESSSTSGGIAVTVHPGTINGVIPSGILVPTLVVTSGMRYICIDATTDGKAVTSAEIAVKTTAPAPPAETAESAPTAFTFLLGVVTNSTVYRTIPCNNITVPILPTISVEDVTYSARLRNFTQYYNWGL